MDEIILESNLTHATRNL